MDTGIVWRIVWVDEHLAKVEVTAWNGRFLGTASCYAGHDVFRMLAESLRGFPATREDRREVVLGDLQAGSDAGGARLLFYCIDGFGRACVEVHLRAGIPGLGRFEETARFCLRVEPAAIDRLVNDLRHEPVARGAAICLKAEA